MGKKAEGHVGERERIQLLLWRAGLGATPAQVDAATAKGYTQAVEDMLTYPDAAARPTDTPAVAGAARYRSRRGREGGLSEVRHGNDERAKQRTLRW